MISGDARRRHAPRLAVAFLAGLAVPLAVGGAMGQPPPVGGAAAEAGAGEAPAGGEAVRPDAAGGAEDQGGARPARRLSDLGGSLVPWHQRARSAAGLFVMVGLAYLLSTARRRVVWPLVAWGLGLQLLFGVLVLRTPVGLAVFGALNEAVVRLLTFTDAGSRFLFGPVLDGGFVVAFQVLPIIIFFSSLMAVAYHARVVQPVVQGVAWVMQRTLGTSGAETLSAAANIFVGQTEAPLLVRPFVHDMTRSELMAVMTGGFATVAGSVLGAYVEMLRGHFSDIGGHLVAASVMSAPAALLVAKVMVPETETPTTLGVTRLEVPRTYANLIDAAASGAADGLKLALNVGAMLLAFLALVAAVNYLLGLPSLLWNQGAYEELAAALEARSLAPPPGCASPADGAAWAACVDEAARALDRASPALPALSLEGLLGLLFWPFAFAMGVPLSDCGAVGALLGEKLVLTELVAYIHLGDALAAGRLGPRGALIATYALCGFANFGSIAIQIGGIGGIAPERRQDLARLGLSAMIGGTLAAFMTACVAGILV